MFAIEKLVQNNIFFQLDSEINAEGFFFPDGIPLNVFYILTLGLS